MIFDFEKLIFSKRLYFIVCNYCFDWRNIFERYLDLICLSFCNIKGIEQLRTFEPGIMVESDYKCILTMRFEFNLQQRILRNDRFVDACSQHLHILSFDQFAHLNLIDFERKLAVRRRLIVNHRDNQNK